MENQWIGGPMVFYYLKCLLAWFVFHFLFSLNNKQLLVVQLVN